MKNFAKISQYMSLKALCINNYLKYKRVSERKITHDSYFDHVKEHGLVNKMVILM